MVPGREGLFTTLANNLYIINQQKNQLDQLAHRLTQLQLYNKASSSSAATAASLRSATPASAR